MTGARPFSIRRRLLAWLLVATAAFGALALVDTWREAERMATALADRVLAGSALVIAERASLDDTGQIAIEIPYGALEMLSSAAEDRVFYRVDGPPGRLVTGYGDLPVARALPGGEPAFADDVFRGEPVRVASLSRAASTGIDEVPVIVTVAETTTAREELTRAILMRSALRLLLMILGAALIVGIAVTLLVSGSVVVESIFSVPGIGQLLTQAVLNRDYPLVQGGLLLLTAVLVGVNILVDVLYAMLDPRVRLGA